MTVAILGLSLYLLGIAFAPIITPHLSEAFGRATIYLFSLPLFSLFILGAAFSQNFASVAVCRFFAGFFGGPCLVLIEGTFADVWTGEVTLSYYSVLALASFVGTGAGKPTSTDRSITQLTSDRSSRRRLRLCRQGLALDAVHHADACLGRVLLWPWHARDLP